MPPDHSRALPDQSAAGPRSPYLHPDGEYISIGFGNGPDTLLKIGGQNGPAGDVDRERAAMWVEQVARLMEGGNA